jgi:hypothetical protein
MADMDRFDKGTALVLEKLYASFPRRLGFRVNELDQDADDDALKTYADTILFLAHEGFIRYDSWSPVDPPVFQGVSLTMKGLAVLNSIPDALAEKETLGQRLRRAISDGSGETTKAVVHEIISVAVSGAFRAASG